MDTYEERIRDAELVRKVSEEVSEVVKKYIPTDLYSTSGLTEYEVEEIESKILPCLFNDLIALASRDKAAKGSSEYVLEMYSTFRAVMYYRIANTIYNYENMDQEMRRWRAIQISDDAKVKTRIDIHPAAEIGKRFVIDHGIGTVIGEDCIIGCDCYMLNGVVLGVRKFGDDTSESKEITDNIPERRHPTIGSKVRISAFAKILGPITVGDDVFISPHCVITHDIPSNCKVVIVNQLQICRGSTCDHREIYGIVPEDNGIICIYGKGLQDSSVLFVAESLDDDSREINGIETIIKEKYDDMIKLQVSIKNKIKNDEIKLKPKEVKMVITKDEKEMVITESIGLRRAIETLMENRVSA